MLFEGGKKLTFHLHCCGRRQGMGLTCRKSPSYPGCFHKIAAILIPNKQNINSCTVGLAHVCM